MKRIIVDLKKLTPKILELLSEKYPGGYNDRDVIVFENHHNEIIEAVEVKTKDIIYLVKVNCRLHYTSTNFKNADIKVNALGNVTFEEEE